MLLFPAKAESVDLAATDWSIILIALAIIVVAALLAAAPIAIAHARWHRHARAVLLSTLLWALLAAASSISTVHDHLKWSRDHLIDIQTGYLTPSDTTGRPGWPWPLWIILAVAYLALCAFALSQKRPPRP